ncbi:unnamed protein product [Closterium sp. NIES-54]
MDRVHAMTTGASLSSKFWPYALEYAAWLHNRIGCSSNPSAHSPYFMMTRKAADVSMARTFGCLCYYLPSQGSFEKFEQRGQTGMFLGLSNSQKAWIVRDLASDVDTDTRSARFFYDLMLPDAESLLERQRYLEEVSPHIDGWTSGGEGFGSRFDSFPASPPSPTSPTTAQGQEVDATQEDSPIDDAAETGEGATASDLPPAGVSVPEVAESNNMENEASHLYDFAYPPDGIKLAAHDATPRRVHFNPTVTVVGREEQGTDGMTGLDVLFGKQRATQAFNVQQHVLGCAATGIPMVDLTYKDPKTLKDMTTDPYAPLWQAAVDAELAKFDELEAYEVVDRADVPKGTTVLTKGVNTADVGLVYGGGDLVLRGYTDSDYANEVGCHSVGGYVFTLGGAAVSWRTKHQTVIATSTAEAEYIAMFEGAREATYLRRLCDDLGFPQQEPTVLFVDNQSAISLATGEQMSQRTKHMEVRYHWTQKAVQDGVVLPEYCPTAQQAADYLTKPITAKQHLTYSLLCGLQPIPPGTPPATSRQIDGAGAALTWGDSWRQVLLMLLTKVMQVLLILLPLAAGAAPGASGQGIRGSCCKPGAAGLQVLQGVRGNCCRRPGGAAGRHLLKQPPGAEAVARSRSSRQE